MSRVQDPAPEHPDPLTPDIEKWNLGEPECLVCPGEGNQSSPSEGYHALDVRPDRCSIACRQERFGRRLGQSDKLREKPPLGENLMNQNLPNRAAPGMGPEVELVVLEFLPYRRELVRLRGIRIDDMLKDGTRPRNVVAGDVRVRIFHGTG
jgi:hypothetical protein